MKIKRKVKTKYNMTAYMRDVRERDVIIGCAECADPKRRKRLELDPEKWLRHYFPNDFYLPFGDQHREIIRAGVTAMRDGTSMAVAAPRGDGKTTLLSGLAVYGSFIGLCKFVLMVSWKFDAGKKTFRGWVSELAENKLLLADYPEICTPFAESTQATRIRKLRIDKATPFWADVRTTEGYLVLPNKAVLASASIQGSTRGMRVKVKSGWARPDVIFLDDPQDKETATSQAAVNKIIDRIDGDLMSMSGPDRRITTMAAVTVIARDDVAERLLSRADTIGIRCRQVIKWPGGWGGSDSEITGLMMEFDEARCKGDGGAAVRAFYRKHKKELTKGMEITWKYRFDKDRGDPDAYFAALYDWCRLGEKAFMAERQNDPLTVDASIYDLTPEMIIHNIYQGRKPYEVPEGAEIIVAATDINFYGLHSSAIAFANDRTGSIIYYGRYDNNGRGVVPKNCTDAEARRLVMSALIIHGKQIAGMKLMRGKERPKIDLWLIDAGYMPDVVRRYIEDRSAEIGIKVMACHGSGASRYNPARAIGRPREQCHLTKTHVIGRWISYNADYWREIAQRGWLAEPGATGSLGLFEGHHSEFAEHICGEKLIERLEGKTGTVWKWHTAPGRHDYGDAVMMAYIAGAWQGVGNNDVKPVRKKAKIQYVRTKYNW